MSFLAFTEANQVTKLLGMPAQKVAYNVKRLDAIELQSADVLVKSIMDDLFFYPQFKRATASGDPMNVTLPLTMGTSTYIPITSCNSLRPRCDVRHFRKSGCDFYYKHVPDQGTIGFIKIRVKGKGGTMWYSMRAFYISDADAVNDMSALFTWMDIAFTLDNAGICDVLDIDFKEYHFENLDSRMLTVRNVILPALATILYTGRRLYANVVVASALNLACAHMENQMDVPPFRSFYGTVADAVNVTNRLYKHYSK